MIFLKGPHLPLLLAYRPVIDMIELVDMAEVKGLMEIIEIIHVIEIIYITLYM